jgi:taurine transport system substrate-binding protein
MKKLLAVLVSAVLLLAVLSGCSQKQESGTSADVPPKVTIGTMIGATPEGIALGEGWLTEALGTEVDIVYFDAGRDVLNAIASGSIDIGMTGSPTTAIGIANGVPYQVFYIQDVLGDNDGLIVRGNLGIHDAQGLIGRRIATTFTSTSHYSLMNYLKINNINPSDVDIIDMGSGEILAAFIEGRIDGAYTWDPILTNMRNNGGAMLTSSRELADRGYAVMELTIVRTEFAERYPDVVKAYVRTMDRGVALYRNDPKTVGAGLARQTGLTAEENLALLEGIIMLSVNEQMAMRWAGSSALAMALYNTAMFFYEQGNIPREPSIEIFQQAVTNRYLDPWGGGGGGWNMVEKKGGLEPASNLGKIY